MKRKIVTHALVAVWASTLWLMIFLRMTISTWAGFDGVHIDQRWGSGSGPIVQVGVYNGDTFGIAFYRPATVIPWAVLVDGDGFRLQSGQ